jgi:SAM-dependent methyltransferase
MDNGSFWDMRYNVFPVLGSGPGSRAYAAWIKQKLIRETIATQKIRSILDIGCGDLCWLQAVPLDTVTYLGTDISHVIIERNKINFPQCQFLHHDITQNPVPQAVDLVVCMDVLIHQIQREEFRQALLNILGSISKIGLISYLTPGQSSAPLSPDTPAEVLQNENELNAFLNTAEFTRAQTARHGDLPREIHRLNSNAIVREVAAYPHQTVYEVTLRY